MSLCGTGTTSPSGDAREGGGGRRVVVGGGGILDLLSLRETGRTLARRGYGHDGDDGNGYYGDGRAPGFGSDNYDDLDSNDDLEYYDEYNDGEGGG